MPAESSDTVVRFFTGLGKLIYHAFFTPAKSELRLVTDGDESDVAVGYESVLYSFKMTTLNTPPWMKDCSSRQARRLKFLDMRAARLSREAVSDFPDCTVEIGDRLLKYAMDLEPMIKSTRC